MGGHVASRTAVTYVLRRGCLKIHSSAEKLIQHQKDALAVEQALKTSQEAKQELKDPPVTRLQLVLRSVLCCGKDILDELGLRVVEVQDDGGGEGDLEWLLRDPANTSGNCSPQERSVCGSTYSWIDRWRKLCLNSSSS